MCAGSLVHRMCYIHVLSVARSLLLYLVVYTTAPIVFTRSRDRSLAHSVRRACTIHEGYARDRPSKNTWNYFLVHTYQIRVYLVRIRLEIKKSGRGRGCPPNDSSTELLLSSPLVYQVYTQKRDSAYNVNSIDGQNQFLTAPLITQHSSLFRWRRAPRWSLRKTKDTPRPEDLNHVMSRYSVVCSCSGLCRARIGEIRCTAAAQFYALDSRYLSLSNRAASFSNFGGNCRGGKH